MKFCVRSPFPSTIKVYNILLSLGHGHPQHTPVGTMLWKNAPFRKVGVEFEV